MQSVVVYLQAQGFSNVKAARQLVSADGNAAQAAKAFNTTLESFTLNGKTVYVNTKPALVPSSLGDVVSAVLGLTNAATMSVRPNLQRPHAIVLRAVRADRPVRAALRGQGRADVLRRATAPTARRRRSP